MNEQPFQQEAALPNLQPCVKCTGMGMVPQTCYGYIAMIECDCCSGLGIEVMK